MNSGWTWISSPLLNGPTSDVLGSMGGLVSSDSIIKNQLLFSNYIPGVGWFGQLSGLSPVEAYQVRLSNAGTMSLTGYPTDVTGRVTELNAGWTWLGWPSLTAAPVEVFDDALTYPSRLGSQNDLIKSHFSFTSYLSGFGWFGALTHFEPGAGYMVKLAQANQLISFGASQRRKLKDLKPVASHAAFSRAIGHGQWQISPSSFEHSMCIVAVVIIGGGVIETGDLAAFINGQLRGVTGPSLYGAPVGTYKGHKMYNLMAYGQVGKEGATVTFQYRHPDGHLSALQPSIMFAKDAFIGTVQEPFIIALNSTAPPAAPALNSASTVSSVLPAVDVSTSLSAERQASEKAAKHIGAIVTMAMCGMLCFLLAAHRLWRMRMRGSGCVASYASSDRMAPNASKVPVP